MCDGPLLDVDGALALAEECGFRVVVAATGEPRLLGKGRPDAELIRQLKANRDGIIGRLHFHVEKWDSLVRLSEREPWFSKKDLRPCGDCGGSLFFRSSRRLACVVCMRPDHNEKLFGEVDLLVLARHIGDE